MKEQTNLTPVMEVAIEKSFDIVEKSWESKVFTKLYHSLRTTGLLAKLSDKDFRTLVCLSTFMDAEGRCYPSQQALAHALGISRTAVTKRIKSLLSFRWKERSLVSAKKVRGSKGKFDNTVYTILPESSLRIFDNDNHVNASHVAEGHTNKNQTSNKIYNTVTERNIMKSDPLAIQLAQDMGDMKNFAYYKSAVRKFPPSLLLRSRGEVLEEKNIKKSRGAMFAYLVKKHTGIPKAGTEES